MLSRRAQPFLTRLGPISPARALQGAAQACARALAMSNVYVACHSHQLSWLQDASNDEGAPVPPKRFHIATLPLFDTGKHLSRAPHAIQTKSAPRAGSWCWPWPTLPKGSSRPWAIGTFEMRLKPYISDQSIAS